MLGALATPDDHRQQALQNMNIAMTEKKLSQIVNLKKPEEGLKNALDKQAMYVMCELPVLRITCHATYVCQLITLRTCCFCL